MLHPAKTSSALLLGLALASAACTSKPAPDAKGRALPPPFVVAGQTVNDEPVTHQFKVQINNNQTWTLVNQDAALPPLFPVNNGKWIFRAIPERGTSLQGDNDEIGFIVNLEPATAQAGAEGSMGHLLKPAREFRWRVE